MPSVAKITTEGSNVFGKAKNELIKKKEKKESEQSV
jgi:hypothetical protein